MHEIPAVVDAQHVSYNDVDLRRRRNALLIEPAQGFDPPLVEAFNRHIPEHPIITYYARTGDGRASTFSDFLTSRELHRLALYDEVFRRVDIEHQIAISFPIRSSHVLGIALTRDRRDFSERDRSILNLLRPHIVQAYANAEAIERVGKDWDILLEGLEIHGSVVVRLRGTRPVGRLSRHAHRRLVDHFGPASRWHGPLPDALSRWIAAQHESVRRKRDDAPARRPPLVLEHDGASLTIRLMGDGRQGLLLLTERRMASPGQLMTLGLTRRESEVLALVTQGKTNPEIAAILGTRPKTVSTQLERIYQGLGVKTRTAAAARALTALRPET